MIAARHRRHPRHRALVILLMASLLGFIGGCTVVNAAKGTPGLDISSVKPGALRNDIETHMGEPMRTWITSQGMTYRLYRYDAGIEGKPSEAAAHAFMDVISFGFWEVLFAVDPHSNKGLSPRYQQYHFMAVSYDANELAVGVFPNIGEFAVLPEDGRAVPSDDTEAPR